MAPKKVAQHLVDSLRAKDFNGAYSLFTPEMAGALDATKLESVWKQVTASAGDVQSFGTPATETREPYTIVSIPTKFTRADLLSQVTIDKEGRVAGLYFVPPAPATKPPASTPSDKFTEEQAIVGTAPIELGATLTIPKGDGPFPALVLVHGSGPQDRNETVGGVAVFRDLAHGLAERGIATIRYDKRTKVHPDSFVDKGSFTARDETEDDAITALGILVSHQRIDAKHVGILGHSLGGYLAPRMAAREPKVAFLVMVAASGRPLDVVLEEQLTYLGSLPGGSGAAEGLMKEVAAMRSMRTSGKFESEGLVLGAPAAYYKDLSENDPLKTPIRSGLPIFLLYGGRDYQVTSADRDAWVKRLTDAGADMSVRTIDNLNHLLVVGEGKATPGEYAKPASVSTEAIDAIAKWVKAR